MLQRLSDLKTKGLGEVVKELEDGSLINANMFILNQIDILTCPVSCIRKSDPS